MATLPEIGAFITMREKPEIQQNIARDFSNVELDPGPASRMTLLGIETVEL